MKVTRFFKVLAFVVALISLCVAISANVLVVMDSEKYEKDIIEIKQELKDCKFKFSNGAKAEGETDAEEEETSEPEVLIQPIDVTAEEPAEVIGEPIAAPEKEAAPAEFNLEEKNFLLVDLMKLGTAEIDLKFMDKVEIGGIKATDNNDQFIVNDCMMVFFIALFVAFVLHCISKNVRKTVYGIILMILGYALFVLFFAAGQYFANACMNILPSFEDIEVDLSIIRIIIVAGFTFLAIFIGLPYYRCGSRQMTGKQLRRDKKNFTKENAKLKKQIKALR